MMKIWKIGLVGCGSIAAGAYMPYIGRFPNVEVVAMCDIIPERARDYCKRYGVPNWYSSIDELLSKCDVDIIMDTATIQSHYDINMSALKAGKHLYSQKPVGLTVQEVTDMIEEAERANVKFSASPIHMLRPDIRWAKQMIEDGTIGEVTMIRCTMAHGGPEYFQFREVDPTWFFRPGAGALYDMGVHALHCVTGLLGPAQKVACMSKISEPQRTVRSGRYDGKIISTDQIEDNYIITLDFGKAMGLVDTGFCIKDSKTPSIEIYGTLGTITFTDDMKHPLQIYIDIPERKARGWMTPMLQENLDLEFFQCLAIKDLIDAIEQDRPVGLSPEHARHVVEIMCKAPEAAKQQTVLALETTF
jgi:UDP-N-acetyl-2-amino-2-deoxyglucuronate dehydrogenase